MAPDLLFWSLFFLSVVARNAVEGSATNSTSASATSGASSAAGSSSSLSSSSVFYSSSSFSSQLSSNSASHSSSIVHSSKSTFTSVSTSSKSSTSVLSTATTSSSSSVLSSVLTSSSTHVSSHTSVVFIQTVPSATPSVQSISPDLVTTASSEPSTSSSVATNQQVAAASKGFWSNKGAVGGTFAVVAVAILGLFAALVLVLRRRLARRRSARDTFFDTKNTFEGNDRLSTGPSMISLGDQPMDAHSTPVHNYGATYLVDNADYSITYPPGSSYPAAEEHDSAARQYYASDEPTAPVSQQQYYPTTSDQLYTVGQDPYYPEYYAANGGVGTTQHNNKQPLSYPSYATGPSATVGRESSGYQHSIDSFYGGASGMAL